MNDTTKEVPAPAPKDSKNHMWLNLVIGLLMLMSIGLLITEGLGITRYTEQGKLAAAKNAEASKATEAPKAPEKKVEAPKAEAQTPPAAPAGPKTEEQATDVCKKEIPKVSIVQNCNTTPPVPAPKPARERPPKKDTKAVSPPKGEEKVSSNSERIWLWHTPGATEKNPGPCIVERGEGRGLPPYCSSLKAVISHINGETEEDWAKRITGDGRTGREHPLYQKKD